MAKNPFEHDFESLHWYQGFLYVFLCIVVCAVTFVYVGFWLWTDEPPASELASTFLRFFLWAVVVLPVVHSLSQRLVLSDPDKNWRSVAVEVFGWIAFAVVLLACFYRAYLVYKADALQSQSTFLCSDRKLSSKC